MIGWQSMLEDSAIGINHHFCKADSAPEDEDVIGIAEALLRSHFEQGQPLPEGHPGPPQYHRADLERIEIDHFDSELVQPSPDIPPPDEPKMMSLTPGRPCFKAQYAWAECITLPNRKMAMHVSLANEDTDGKVEEQMIVQQPEKVLQEVEKA